MSLSSGAYSLKWKAPAKKGKYKIRVRVTHSGTSNTSAAEDRQSQVEKHPGRESRPERPLPEGPAALPRGERRRPFRVAAGPAQGDARRPVRVGRPFDVRPAPLAGEGRAEAAARGRAAVGAGVIAGGPASVGRLRRLLPAAAAATASAASLREPPISSM